MQTKKLHTIKKTGFKVPDNYFETLESTLSSHLKLNEMAPTSGFKVPEHYFDTLENTIINSVNQPKEVKVIPLFNWKKVAYTTAVAASVLLFITLFFNKPEQVTINTLETAQLENYFIEENISPTEFASLFSKENLQDVQLISDGYSSQTLEDFVFDNLDIEDLIKK